MELWHWMALLWLGLAIVAGVCFGFAVRGMRHDEPRPALLPTLWSALRQRAQGIAHWWRERVMRSLYRCVPWFRASNKPN